MFEMFMFDRLEMFTFEWLEMLLVIMWLGIGRSNMSCWDWEGRLDDDEYSEWVDRGFRGRVLRELERGFRLDEECKLFKLFKLFADFIAIGRRLKEAAFIRCLSLSPLILAGGPTRPGPPLVPIFWLKLRLEFDPKLDPKLDPGFIPLLNPCPKFEFLSLLQWWRRTISPISPMCWICIWELCVCEWGEDGIWERGDEGIFERLAWLAWLTWFEWDEWFDMLGIGSFGPFWRLDKLGIIELEMLGFIAVLDRLGGRVRWLNCCTWSWCAIRIRWSCKYDWECSLDCAR